MTTERKNIEQFSASHGKDNVSIKTNPHELTAGQRLTRFMSIILLALFCLLVVASLYFWDGSKAGKYSDLWEYTKLIGTTIIGGVVATYMQPNND